MKTHFPFLGIQTLLFSFIRVYGRTFTTNRIELPIPISWISILTETFKSVAIFWTHFSDHFRSMEVML